MGNELIREKIKVKKRSGFRKGKGFSIEELNRANISLHLAKINNIPIDYRRKTFYEDNIGILKNIELKK